MKPIEAHSTAKIKAKVTREEQAAHELGTTDFAPGTRITLVIGFLAVITSVPLIQLCTAFREPERISRFADGLRAFIPEWARVREADGVIEVARLLPSSEQILKVEEQWEEDSVVGEALLPRMQSMMLTLGQGNEKVYAGRDGWLYYRSDFDHVAGRPFLDASVMNRRTKIADNAKAPQPDPIKGIVHFRDQLAKRGIELIVMPMPVKPTIYPDYFSHRYPLGSRILQNPSYGEFKQRLLQGGVAVFDPSDLLAAARASQPGQPLYLKTDTHWTPQAMESTAARLAAFVRETATLQEPRTDLYTTAEKTIEAPGDIAMMLKLPAGQKVFPSEKVQLRQVLAGGQLWRPAADAEVLFLGDSFANIYSLEPMGWGESAGFVEHLSLALGLPVDAITRNDGGSHATREMLANELKRGTDRLEGKKLVIWEFAARELSSGDWKELSMDLGVKRDMETYVPAEGRTVAAEGIVRAVSPSPRPGSVPYKDHILMLHLTDLKSTGDPAAAGKDAIVYIWSMRENVSTPASRFRPGDTVRLRLRPWSDVTGKYEAINRSELDGEEFMLATPTWAE